ncbi:hypothetical protein ACOSQ2_029166 [Xanthoceras sorbifolium]
MLRTYLKLVAVEKHSGRGKSTSTVRKNGTPLYEALHYWIVRKHYCEPWDTRIQDSFCLVYHTLFFFSHQMDFYFKNEAGIKAGEGEVDPRASIAIRPDKGRKAKTNPL